MFRGWGFADGSRGSAEGQQLLDIGGKMFVVLKLFKTKEAFDPEPVSE